MAATLFPGTAAQADSVAKRQCGRMVSELERREAT